jgi:crotonobetainyl-CoA:carnitine CoA-transferase CaiB-like acyl-CoA transferase
VHNFVPGKEEELKISYEHIRKFNEKIIYAGITGYDQYQYLIQVTVAFRYGPDGPYKSRLAYDVIISGLGGLMGITGPASGEPCKVPETDFIPNII